MNFLECHGASIPRGKRRANGGDGPESSGSKIVEQARDRDLELALGLVALLLDETANLQDPVASHPMLLRRLFRCSFRSVPLQSMRSSAASPGEWAKGRRWSDAIESSSKANGQRRVPRAALSRARGRPRERDRRFRSFTPCIGTVSGILDPGIGPRREVGGRSRKPKERDVLAGRGCVNPRPGFQGRRSFRETRVRPPRRGGLPAGGAFPRLGVPESRSGARGARAPREREAPGRRAM